MRSCKQVMMTLRRRMKRGRGDIFVFAGHHSLHRCTIYLPRARTQFTLGPRPWTHRSATNFLSMLTSGDRLRRDGHQHVQARRRPGWRGSRRLGFVSSSVLSSSQSHKSATIPSSSSHDNPGTSPSAAAAAGGGCSGTFPMWEQQASGVVLACLFQLPHS